MTAFVASLLLKAQGQEQVKAALQSVSGEARRAGDAVGTTARTGAQATRQLAAGAEEAARDIDAMAASAIRADAATEALGTTNRVAANNVGNLVAQFNDIGMMLAAGQNPLQLAIQQGTQITQVIGPMGATGAVSALGSAFMGMLSPINLATIGGIAAGAALFQAFTSSGEAVVTLEDRVQTMIDTVEAFRNASATAALPWRDLVEQFGTGDTVLRATLADLAAIERIKASEAIDATADALGRMVTEAAWWDDSSPNTLAQRFLGFARNSEQARAVAEEFIGNLVDLSSSDQSAQLAAALDLKAQLDATTGGYRSMNAEQRQLYDGLTQIVLQLQALGVEAGEAAGQFEGLSAAQIAAYEAYGRSRVESDAQLSSAEALLAELQAQAEMQALIAQYGADSREVAEARHAAEREVHAEMVAGLGVNEEMAAKLMEAWEAANGIATVDMAGGIANASAQAQALAAHLGISLDAAIRLASIGLRAPDGEAVIFDPRDPRYDPDRARRGRVLQEMGDMQGEADRGRRLERISISSSDTGTGRGTGTGAASGGGARAARTETDAIARLIQRKEQELALARATNPLQREAIRNRELLAEATATQRDRIDELNAALEDERAAEAFREGVTDGLYDIITTAESAGDAIDMLNRKLIDAGIQALLLGEGPLAGLFGTRGSGIGDLLFGGIFGGGGGGGGTGSFGLPMPFAEGGMIWGAAAPDRSSRFAEGGMIWGAGGPREDRVPIYASPGEFMVNAQATARNRAVLEFINAGGTLGRFADGGMIGGGAGGGMLPAPGITMPVHIDARGAQRGVGEEIAEALARAMPEVERRAVAAVARAQGKGKLR